MAFVVFGLLAVLILKDNFQLSQGSPATPCTFNGQYLRDNVDDCTFHRCLYNAYLQLVTTEFQCATGTAVPDTYSDGISNPCSKVVTQCNSDAVQSCCDFHGQFIRDKSNRCYYWWCQQRADLSLYSILWPCAAGAGLPLDYSDGRSNPCVEFVVPANCKLNGGSFEPECNADTPTTTPINVPTTTTT
ncbi:unnamed protein product, partial [Owenia fusiformis]